jgi:nitrate/nitrite transporter NarK
MVLKSHLLDRSQAPSKRALVCITASDIGLASSFYLAGAVMGALGFGWMTDRLGRRPLFFITLSLYLVSTAATAFAWNLESFCLFRMLTGAGMGGEYSAVNSTIQEMIPARGSLVQLVSPPTSAGGSHFSSVPHSATSFSSSGHGSRKARAGSSSKEKRPKQKKSSRKSKADSVCTVRVFQMLRRSRQCGWGRLFDGIRDLSSGNSRARHCLFYAAGTAVGGVGTPFLFGALIQTGGLDGRLSTETPPPPMLTAKIFAGVAFLLKRKPAKLTLSVTKRAMSASNFI